MAQSWGAINYKLRADFDTPSKNGVSQPWSPAGKNEGWRDYADYAPELREYNEQKKALRSQQPARARSRSTSRRIRSRSSSPDEVGAVLRRSGTRASEEIATSWRLSFRGSVSRRTQLQIKQQRPKRVGQLPVFSGLDTFTLRNMSITHLDGMGLHPEVRRVYLQQNFLTSFEGWEHQPQLVELHAGDNLIESFKLVSPTPVRFVFHLSRSLLSIIYQTHANPPKMIFFGESETMGVAGEGNQNFGDSSKTP